LCVVMSRLRTTFNPSTSTFIDQPMKYIFPFVVLVMIPFFGALPASSPEEVLKKDWSLNMISCPPIDTVLEPSEASLASAVLGYGMGTPVGVAGVWGGVKQTSGNSQIDFPCIDLLEISIELAKTGLPMALDAQWLVRTSAARLPQSALAWINAAGPGA
jgi:hypothetical protein